MRIFLIIGVLVSTAASAASGAAPADRTEERPRVMATIPPVADLLEEIAGARCNVVCLLPGGASPHTYEPRPSDARAAAGALLLVYVDRRFDGWAADLEGAPRLALAPLLPDSVVLRFDSGEGEGAAGDTTGRHAEEGGIDPHFWTDPLAVRSILPAIASRLAAADREGAPVYRRGAEALALRLDALHRRIEEETAPLRGRAVLLSHPFLRYFLRRYGIGVAAVIVTIPGKEPTAREIARLVRIGRERRPVAVVTMPQLSRKGADLVAESTGLPVRVVDPLGGVPGLERYGAIVEGIAAALQGGSP